MTQVVTPPSLLHRTALATVLIIAVAGCTGEPADVATDQQIRSARLLQVAPTTRQRQLKLISRVEASQSVDLAFQVSGPLTELPLREGQFVAAGTLLAALDSVDFKLAIREAEVALDLANQDLTRKRSLLSRRGVSQALVDDAKGRADLAQIRLEQARADLADSRLTAPFDAYIARRYLHRHTNITRGTPVLRILDLDPLQLVASVPEAVLATITAEQVDHIEAQFPFAPDTRYPVTYLEHVVEADPVAQTYEVSFALPRPTAWNLLPGMTATVTVHLRTQPAQDQALTIPASALVSAADKSLYVWVVDPSTYAVAERRLSLGPVTSTGITVTAGLAAGELIVISGAQQLQPGMRVTPIGKPQDRPLGRPNTASEPPAGP